MPKQKKISLNGKGIEPITLIPQIRENQLPTVNCWVSAKKPKKKERNTTKRRTTIFNEGDEDGGKKTELIHDVGQVGNKTNWKITKWQLPELRWNKDKWNSSEILTPLSFLSSRLCFPFPSFSTLHFKRSSHSLLQLLSIMNHIVYLTLKNQIGNCHNVNHPYPCQWCRTPNHQPYCHYQNEECYIIYTNLFSPVKTNCNLIKYIYMWIGDSIF